MQSLTTLPFQTAILISNGISVNPKSPLEAQKPFEALCSQLDLETQGSKVLEDLRSVPLEGLLQAVDSLGALGTFRTITDGEWIAKDLLSGKSRENLPML